METIGSFMITILLLLFALNLAWRVILTRGVREQVLGEIIHDFFQGIWHLVFGPRKVQVVPRRKRRKKYRN